MKNLLFGILAAVLINLLSGFYAYGGNLANPPEDSTPSAGHSAFRIGGLGPHGGIVIQVDSSGKHGVEAKPRDEPEAVTWDLAVAAVRKHGEGWRLPTIAELALMYDRRKLIGGFENEDYWSAKEQDVNSAWIQGFGLGDQDRYNKQSTIKVRAVRTF